MYVEMKNDNDNPNGLKLNNSNKKNMRKEGGCCKGKGNNSKNLDNNENEGRNKRINSKISTISVEENNVDKNNDEEDF